MTILWIKALHVFFMIAWMVGIFYLPRLFVYHAQTDSQAVRDQFKIMERRLWMFVTPFALLTLIFGVALIYLYGKEWFKAAKWLHYKIMFVFAFYIYHGYLYTLVKAFAKDQNKHTVRFYRALNEVPVIALLVVICLAVVK